MDIASGRSAVCKKGSLGSLVLPNAAGGTDAQRSEVAAGVLSVHLWDVAVDGHLGRLRAEGLKPRLVLGGGGHRWRIPPG